ncbi:sodium/proton antiporter, CPA1 family [Enterococcus faecalis]|uniref:cation:proton antiporter n=1 Tax=Enterococcus faecalis TaxID=1351 RepID=UPI00045BA8CA|nr:cation:proton antiporter [Enterococcus faecalis]KAJ81583.1 Na+/H+ antiporter [Enterococcus faecalis MTUP9]SDN38119.1 sodium/proton antiporter, CPA1 family [Enterococcus faecalis]
MEFTFLIIVFALSITFSNIFNRIVPVIPLPIVQIIVGVLIGLTKMGQEIEFEPEVFLVMIIAPLLFREGELINLKAMMKNFGMILFLAFFGVLITLVGVGWTLHMILPTLPLAACFAFGAALGPTDAVAVGSLSGRIDIPERSMNILSGEGLINDASGVTAFQFALAALLTGSFSPVEAAGTLVISSIGGAVVGIVLVLLKQQIVHLLETAVAKDVTGYLLIELLLPFIAYLISELIGVSGIIAAVIAGIMQASSLKKVSLFEAELSNVGESIWSMIEFTLNALVFLFLGIELSQVFSPIWIDQQYSNWFLLMVVLIISAVVFLIRFLAIFSVYTLQHGLKKVKNAMNEMLILTFGGVKGTVSLATIFILPTAINGEHFKERPLLLFITACVILVTLIGGILVLPFLTDSETEVENEESVEIDLLRDVIDVLKQQNEENPRGEMNAVIENYQDRLKELYTEQLSAERKQEVQELRTLIVSIERDGLEESLKQGEISVRSYRMYQRLITRMQRSIAKQLLSIVGFWLLFARQIISILLHPKLFFNRGEASEEEKELRNEELENIRQVFLRNSQVILKSLDNLRGVYDDDLIDFFIDGRLDLAHKFEKGEFIDSYIVHTETDYVKDLLLGFQEERRMIDHYEQSERISIIEANELRKNVNLLESYSISGEVNNVPLKLFVKNFNKE